MTTTTITTTNNNNNNNNNNYTSSGTPPSLPNGDHRIEKRLANSLSNSSPALPAGGCGCGSAHCACGSSCRCASRANPGGCSCARAQRSRSRRNAEYGTLETIDESSLNALRKEYKLGLKEITLSPDEDPAEALMRYNAASVREALERASQEPLEISGDQLAAGETVANPPEEYVTPTTTVATPTGQSVTVTEREQMDAASNERSQMRAELAAARIEFKKLYGLIESLKEQLTKAEQRLRDCRQVEATSTSSSTSSTTSTTTTTTSTTTTEKPPSAEHWERLLASKGYDTNYLSKTHEQQYAQGDQLDLSKPDSNGSGDYSYQELQPYDPDNKAKRATSSSSTTEPSAGALHQAQLLNAALHANAIKDTETEAGSSEVTDTTTPHPYALRGKFVRRRSTRLGLRTTRQAKVTKASGKATKELSLLRERSTKLDQLIDVLNELLRLQLQREKAFAQMAGSNRVPNSIPINPASTTRRPNKYSKRLRRRRKQRPASSSSSISSSSSSN
ncbi:hypothetical protein AWZ03_012879 [Drosophila navojoa]|uniref:Uncharacterized protein n=1 Tax=Drosophila navojoa TaxID=7232 RepID=A0A484AXG8_DRONA|nr:hypothetical protein AWZ03_012879 [Drosophila navojoa]